MQETQGKAYFRGTSAIELANFLTPCRDLFKPIFLCLFKQRKQSLKQFMCLQIKFRKWNERTSHHQTECETPTRPPIPPQPTEPLLHPLSHTQQRSGGPAARAPLYVHCMSDGLHPTLSLIYMGQSIPRGRRPAEDVSGHFLYGEATKLQKFSWNEKEIKLNHRKTLFI